MIETRWTVDEEVDRCVVMDEEDVAAEANVGNEIIEMEDAVLAVVVKEVEEDGEVNEIWGIVEDVPLPVEEEEENSEAAEAMTLRAEDGIRVLVENMMKNVSRARD